MRKQTAVEILEAYIPAKLEYLARLYEWLQAQLYSHPKPLLQGFSIYEVNGAFHGKEVYEERTLVVRVVVESARRRRARVGDLIRALLAELHAITQGKEEELWIIRTPAHRVAG
jgi:hypothetical protein